tara:strand:- start:195 stop:713 length:519 start_codon:yes stop_codon:yes gene_type:complete
MRKGIFILLMAITSIACKSDKKNENGEESPSSSETVQMKVESESEKFEKSLLDYREIAESYAPDFPVQGFGMQKFNDSTFAFVFKVGNIVTNEVVEKYSIGLKGYHQNSDKPYTKSASPSLTTIGNNGYVIIKRKIENIKYFDSLETYSYTRDNWKASGKIGDFKLKDILFE